MTTKGRELLLLFYSTELFDRIYPSLGSMYKKDPSCYFFYSILYYTSSHFHVHQLIRMCTWASMSAATSMESWDKVQVVCILQ